jgi:hypothetical protein
MAVAVEQSEVEMVAVVLVLEQKLEGNQKAHNFML